MFKKILGEHMRHWRVFILWIMLIAIGIFSYMEYSSAKLPVLRVKASGESITTIQSSSCWKGLFSEKCVDKVYSSPYEMGRVYKSARVKPGDTIQIQFDKKSIKGTLAVEHWFNEKDSKPLKIKGNKWQAPEKPGEYIYYVDAKWKSGDVGYAFSVSVK